MLHELTIAGIDPYVEPGLSDFARDTFSGLSSVPRFLLPKYFYDDKGSLIFEEITRMPGYYLTGCELEIFSEETDSLVEALIGDGKRFSLIELGPGSGIKTSLLLECIIKRKADFKYFPVDISAKANEQLVLNMGNEFPFLDIIPYTGDYFNLPALNGSFGDSGKIILFLGSNIGNMDQNELSRFLDGISSYTRKGDRLLIGFDLKKSPEIIMGAYDDPYGITKKFNINHLLRINRELEADFNPDNFEHHTTYDPVTGEVRSWFGGLRLFS
jgi:dimethylhistidine N-methyltransferase